MKWGEKKPEREEKEEEERSGKKVGAGVKTQARRHVGFEPKSSASGTLAPRHVSSAPASMVPS